jgi:hypothetical protein
MTMDRRAHQPLLPDSFQTAQPSGGEEHAGQSTPRPPKRRVRSASYRLRHQLPPWRALAALPVAALVLHLLPFPPMFVRMLVLIAAGGLLGWREYVRHVRWDFRAYALMCVTAGTAWLLYATRLGLWAGAGRFSFLMLLAGWLPLSWVWWDRHRVRTSNTPVAFEPVDPFITDWEDRVEPAMDWSISDPEDIDSGVTYRLQLVPGQAIEDAESAKKKIASLLRISRSRLTFEAREGDIPGIADDESVITMIVTPKVNPHHTEDQTWTGATLDKTTGLYRHGVYPDAAAFLRLFRVEGGRPIRACNSLWTGTTGSGKSRGNAIKIGEQVLSGMFVTWYADGKGGASAPELETYVDWYADSVDETIKMLRAAWKVMKVRAKTIKKLHQAAFRGQRAIYLGDRAFPFLQIVIDEAQESLKQPIVAKLVKALLRMGNECGIGVDLLTQVPLLVELGGSSGEAGAEVIRAMAKAGNVAVYKADETFTGRVTLTSELEVDPSQLPRIPGVCYVAGHTARSAMCRTYYVTKEALFGWLVDAPVMTLEAASARAAGEDYVTRYQRAQDSEVEPEEMDLGDLNAELAVLLGERLPGQAAPGQVQSSLTVKQAVFEVVKSAGGPIKREQIGDALAANGAAPSKSAVDQALRWWCEQSHMERTEHGHYDLISREGGEDTDAQPVEQGAPV